METTDYLMVFITAPSYGAAYHLAKVLISENLAACATILQNAISIYNWENKVEENQESQILIKTTSDKFEQLENRVKELHSYKVPEIVAVKIEKGSKDYLSWIKESVKE